MPATTGSANLNTPRQSALILIAARFSSRSSRYIASLVVFAWLLTRVDSDAAGRAYAAYGGIYICASLLWLWSVEGVRPDRWDVGGAALCLIGTCVILLAPRGA